ncbi:unnamed protein product [Amoebophrya sp. A25]|nr:unnamed protein product [Amoebophrya sp. A25]|eukprot:GSA25T00008858001.1
MSSDSDVQTDPSPRSSDKEALKGGGAEGSADTTGAGAYVHLYDTRPWAEQTSDSDQGAGGPGPAALGERALGTLPQGGQPEPAAAGTQTTPKANKNGNGNRLDGQENLL